MVGILHDIQTWVRRGRRRNTSSKRKPGDVNPSVRSMTADLGTTSPLQCGFGLVGGPDSASIPAFRFFGCRRSAPGSADAQRAPSPRLRTNRRRGGPTSHAPRDRGSSVQGPAARKPGSRRETGGMGSTMDRSRARSRLPNCGATLARGRSWNVRVSSRATGARPYLCPRPWPIRNR